MTSQTLTPAQEKLATAYRVAHNHRRAAQLALLTLQSTENLSSSLAITYADQVHTLVSIMELDAEKDAKSVGIDLKLVRDDLKKHEVYKELTKEIKRLESILDARYALECAE